MICSKAMGMSNVNFFTYSEVTTCPMLPNCPCTDKQYVAVDSLNLVVHVQRNYKIQCFIA